MCPLCGPLWSALEANSPFPTPEYFIEKINIVGKQQHHQQKQEQHHHQQEQEHHYHQREH